MSRQHPKTSQGLPTVIVWIWSAPSKAHILNACFPAGDTILRGGCGNFGRWSQLAKIGQQGWALKGASWALGPWPTTMWITFASCSNPHISALLSSLCPMEILSYIASLRYLLTEMQKKISVPTEASSLICQLFCFFWDRVLLCGPGSPWTFRKTRCLCLLCGGITGVSHNAQCKPPLYILCKVLPWLLSPEVWDRQTSSRSHIRTLSHGTYLLLCVPSCPRPQAKDTHHIMFLLEYLTPDIANTWLTAQN